MGRPLLAALLLASATGFAPRTPLQHGLRPLAASPLQLRPVLPRARKSPLVIASAADAAAEAPAAEATKPKEWDEGFRKRRLLIFAFTVVAYACFYLTRNSLYYTAPAMVAAPELNLDITSIGIITSIFPLFYGCSKFVSGVVGDVLSARAMLACGLGLTVRRAAPRRAAPRATPPPAPPPPPHSPSSHHLHHLQAVVNIMFGLGSTLPWFCVLWGLNGILQGWGGPACAKIITSWFATKERGTYWGLWNISHNLGAFLAPLLAGTAARALGWRWGVFAPGLIGLSVAGLVYAIVRNSPEDIGRQPAEVAQADDAAAVEVAEAVAEAEQSGGAEMGMVERLRKNVLSQPAVWLLAFTFLFVYLIRQALTSWMVFFLIEKKGVSDFAQAAAAAAMPASTAATGRLHD